MLISIIVPALNEGDRIGPLIQSLQAMPGDREIIVSDGGSTDGTAEKAVSAGARVITAPPGRAAQMNAGAKSASGDVFWFVHADSVPALSALEDIGRAVSGGAAGGFFRLHFYDADDRFLRFIERTSHTRAKDFCLIFGDQGLFLRRDIFEELGGFAPLALMEDWELSRRLRPLHKRGLICALDTAIGTSARRYLQHGRFRTWLKMNVVKALYILGVPTERLRKIYG
ncbi:MAG: TIGR04283 family arsenosugar biosynthesis glycosyltransferase [Fretibacterium sp.]|nr:TIGR04283 family arsenosugar biosynthesis glycosyltransferase [Fretibacterium sp.]